MNQLFKPGGEMRTAIMWVFLAAVLLASLAGCAQFLDPTDRPREAWLECSTNPGSPGCYPPGWGYKAGMGLYGE
jgi:hypothetical protein